MTVTIDYSFLHISVVETNKILGIAPGTPDGLTAADATGQELVNHQALVELTRAVEGLENWAFELTHKLRDAGIIELSAP
jgi:hypothetical protein